MPRESAKKHLIKLIEERAFAEYMFLEIFWADGDYAITRQSEIIEDLLCFFGMVECCRYGIPSIKHSVPKSLEFRRDVLPYLDETRFKHFLRVTKTSFNIIFEMIKDDEVFNGIRSSQQLPINVQLMIVLYRLGSNGEGSSVAKIAAFFGIGDGGTIERITKRVFKAILKFSRKYIRWPDQLERETLVAETMDELPYCIGYVDGTEIKLAEKPQQDPEAYFSRKHMYSLKVQATCDHKKIIRHLVVGWPGSVHDSRIFKSCPLSTNPTSYFSGLQWIAGDSAYKLTPQVLTPFRNNSTSITESERKNFNRRHSRYRVRIEHTFGLLKERFNSLKELKTQIKNDTSILEAGAWIFVCAILHNIITEQNNYDTFDSEDLPLNETEKYSIPVTNLMSIGEKKRIAICQLMFE